MTLSQIKKLPHGKHEAILGGTKGIVEMYTSEIIGNCFCRFLLLNGYLHIDLKRSKKQGLRLFTIIEGLCLDTIIESHELNLT